MVKSWPILPIFARESDEGDNSVESNIGSLEPGLLADEAGWGGGGAVRAVEVASPALSDRGGDQAGADWAGEEVEDVRVADLTAPSRPSCHHTGG